jgi:hypothetical protein
MAYTRTNSAATSGHIASGGLALSNTVNPGDLIVVATIWYDYEAETQTFSDGINSGSYTPAPSSPMLTVSNSFEVGFWYMVANASGIPTITPSYYSPGYGIRIVAASYTGFGTAVPMFASVDQAGTSGASGTAIASGSFNTSQPSEIAFALLGNLAVGITSANIGGVFGNDVQSTDNYLDFFDSIGADPSGLAQNTAVSANATGSASAPWWAMVLGVYPSGSAPPASGNQPLLLLGMS